MTDDDDNDGIPDSIDNADDDDFDNDGVPDAIDNDDDNDGVPDHLDSDDDNDGIPDYIDDDDDNDGIPDSIDNADEEPTASAPGCSDVSPACGAAAREDASFFITMCAQNGRVKRDCAKSCGLCDGGSLPDYYQEPTMDPDCQVK